MSALLFVRDGRTLPFVPVTLAALNAIRVTCETAREGSGARRSYPHALAAYMALLELANDNRADRAAVTQREIGERSQSSRSAVQAALGDLREAGVLAVYERQHGGSRVENEYVIVEPAAAESSATNDTPAREKGDPRPSEKQLSQEELQKKTPPAARARDDEVPEDFPDHLRPHARLVMEALREAAVERGAQAVTARGVGRAVMDFPRKPLVATARELRAWLLDGAGRNRQCIDVVRRYRDWLRKEADLAGPERLATDGTATTHPPGVTPIRRDKVAAREDRFDRRKQAALRVIEQQRREAL